MRREDGGKEGREGKWRQRMAGQKWWERMAGKNGGREGRKLVGGLCRPSSVYGRPKRLFGVP